MKQVRKLLFMLIAVFLSSGWGTNAFSQTLTVCDGTTTEGHYPLYGYYMDASQQVQSLYPSDSLVALRGSEISSLTYYASSSSKTWTSPMTVSLAIVSDADLTNGLITAAMTDVYTGTMSVSGSQMTIAFSSPFVYPASGGNLLIQFRQTTAGNYSSCSFYGVSTTATMSTIQYGSSRTHSASFLPKVTFAYSPPATCPGIASISLDATTAAMANISWVLQSTGLEAPSSYTIKYVAVGNTDTGTITTNTRNVFLTGLNQNTNYFVRVIPDCGTTDGFGKSKSMVFATNPLPCAEYNTPDGQLLHVQVGEGTFTGGCAPVDNFYGNTYSQMLFTPAEIGLTGDISRMAFQYGYSSATTKKTNCTIYMAQTATESLSSSFDAYDASTWVMVYTGALNMEEGWNYFPLSTPFAYDGTSNLLVTVVDNSHVYDGSSYNKFYQTAIDGMVRYLRRDGTSSYTPATVSGGNSYGYRPNTIFESGTCVRVAQGAAPSMEVDGTTVSSIALHWLPGYHEAVWKVEYRAEDETSWTVADAHVTTTSYTITGLNEATKYFVRVTSLVSATEGYSDEDVAYTECLLKAIPFTDNFESYRAPEDMICWDLTVGTPSPVMFLDSNIAIRMNANTLAVLPAFDATANPINTLRVRARVYNPNNNNVEVGVMTDPGDASTFVSAGILTVDVNNAWQNAVVNLTGYTGNGTRIALLSHGSIYIDDVTIEELPPCPEPTMIGVGNTTKTSAIVRFNQETGYTYNLYYRVAGAETWIKRSGVTTVNTELNLAGLQPVTTYEWKISRICSGTEIFSLNSMFFQTECPDNYVTFPYAIGFNGDAIDNCWTNTNGYWSTGTTSYLGTPYEGNGAMGYFKSSHNYSDTLVSPVFDLSAVSHPMLSFAHKQKEWSNDQDKLRVMYRPGDNADWTTLAYYENNIVNWQMDSILLPEKSATYQIAFVAEGDYGYGIYIDAVKVFNLCADTTTIVNQAICADESYTFEGVDYTTTTDYLRDTIWHSYGTFGSVCFNYAELHLMVNPVYDTTHNVTVCDNYDYEGFGFTLSKSAMVTQTYVINPKTTANCDSIIRMNLTVKHSPVGEVHDTLCGGNAYNNYGFAFAVDSAESKDYTLLIPGSAANGCDSTGVLHMVVIPVEDTYIHDTICVGMSYKTNIFDLPAGTVTGNYFQQITSNQGCVASFFLYLTVMPNYAGTINAASCENVTYTENGFNADTAGTYQLSLKSMYGCDSVVTLNLTHNPTFVDTIIAATCQNTDYTANGFNIGSDTAVTGFYSRVARTVNDCDSALVLKLTVGRTYYHRLDTAICQGESVRVFDKQGNIVQSYGFKADGSPLAAGRYTYTIQTQSIYGCDSLIVLNLTIHPSYGNITPEGYYDEGITPFVHYEATVCRNMAYNGYGFEFGADVLRPLLGDHNALQVNTTAYGCDSITELILHINDTSATELNATICSTEAPYNNKGFNESATGEYTLTVSNIDGCDSVVTLKLTVNPSYDTTIYDTICYGLPNYVNASNANFANATGSKVVINTKATGITEYVDTLHTTSCGCDSIVHLMLTVKPVIDHTTLVDAVCFGTQTYVNSDNAAFGSDASTATVVVNLATQGTTEYTATVKDANGCDSVLRLQLTVNPVTYDTTHAVICFGQNYTWASNGQTYDATGFYANENTDVNGCDSNHYLDLFVDTVVNVGYYDVVCFNAAYDSNTFHFDASTAENGTYSHNFTTVRGGCDSNYTLHLTVIPTEDKDTIANICQGTSFDLAGETHSTTGTYKIPYQTEANCDSYYNLALTVHPNYDTILKALATDTVCQYSAYSRDGVFGTAAGSRVLVNTGETGLQYYQFDTVSLWGCDSTVRLWVYVKPAWTEEHPLLLPDGNICQYGSFSWNGFSTTQEDVTTTLVDSTVAGRTSYLKHLVTSPMKFYAGAHYDDEGNYIIDYNTVPGGCDSIVKIDINVHPVYSIPFEDQICQDLNYTLHGFNINGDDLELNVVNCDTLRMQTVGALPCDSIHTLQLSVVRNYQKIFHDTVCNNMDYAGHGWTLNSGYAFQDTTMVYQGTSLVGGCDSVVVVNLNVKATSSTALSAVICENNPYQVAPFIAANGFAGNVTGLYKDTLTNVNGCDSVITLNLTANPVRTTVLRDTVCQHGTYDKNGFSTVAAPTKVLVSTDNAGLYTIQDTNQVTWLGCDSNVTLMLYVAPVSYDTFTVAVCQNSIEYNDHGFLLGGDTMTTGTYQHNYQSVFGCDSNQVLHLSVYPTYGTVVYDTICEGSTYTNYGYRTNAVLAGDHTYTVQKLSVHQCDSTIILNLTGLPTHVENYVATICEGQFYTEHGFNADTTGVYHITGANAYGCDSNITLTLTVNQPTTYSYAAAICQGQTYTENGFNVSEAGVYNDTLVNAKGCDSIVTLTLTVSVPTAYTIDAVICEGNTYTENGFNVNVAGTYHSTVVNANGCDSIVTLNLAVNPAYNVEFFDTVRNGDAYSGNGFNETVGGDYALQFTSVDGCDSTVTLHLVAYPAVSTDLYDTICAGATYARNGFNANATGTYTQNLYRANGADSTVTLYLTVKENSASTIDAAICQGSIYNQNGFLVAVAGTYTQHVTSVNGCDSAITLILTVNQNVTTTLTATICEGDTYTQNGFNASVANVYTRTLTTTAGCDSTVTLMLSMNPAYNTVVNDTICQGSTYTSLGFNETTAGTHTRNLATVNGCDSVITLNLAVRPTSTRVIYDTTCEGNVYTGYGFNVVAAGTYTRMLDNRYGCDSTVTLYLAVNPVRTTVLYDTICQGTAYTSNGFNVSATGVYTRTLSSVTGCDSIVTLNLYVRPAYHFVFTDIACGGETYTGYGFNVTESGTYTRELTSVNGCDSTITLHLTVLEAYHVAFVDTICGGEIYNRNGFNEDATGVYTRTYTAANGCDSIVTLSLTVNPTYAIALHDTICDGDIYIHVGLDIEATEPGVYPIHLTTVNGCDSVITIYLAVMPTYDDTIYGAISSGSTYTDYGFNANTAGTYTQHLQTIHGCDSTVTLILTVNNGINGISELDDITVYPNPTAGDLTVDAEDIVSIEVIDMNGRRVATYTTKQFDISNLAAGNYVLRIVTDRGTAIRRVVKK